MNILAHLFLAQTDINLLVGNFIADHIKGNKIEHFSDEVKRGIMMHRAIDTFTDSHKVVLHSKERLYPKYHKYAGVLIDLFYDHILAKNWSDYSPIALNSFTRTAYQALKGQEHTFPERSKLTLHYMSKQDWLTNYAHLDGMQKAFIGISKRTKFDSKMEEATVDLEKDYELYKKEFELFFPALNEFCIDWKSSN